MFKSQKVVVIVSITVIVLASLLLIANKLADQVGPTAIQKMDTHDLEKKVRVDLLPGSSLETVETYLAKQGIEFSYDLPSKTVFAIVRNVNGSNLIIRKDFSFAFLFDDALTLKSIKAKEQLTGP
jgi:hypothetical protein